MPTFEKILSDPEHWYVTMLASHADKLSRQVQSALSPLSRNRP
jgi:hypothetical protein